MTYRDLRPADLAFFALAAGLVFASLAAASPGSAAPAPPTAFDGSFRLATGETVTGGYFVEGGVGRYLYLDVEGFARGGLFERVEGTNVLRALAPPGAGRDGGGTELELVAGGDGRLDRLVWRQAGEEPVAGERVYPHDERPVRFRSADGTELAGRLLVPRCAGGGSRAHPVVVSVHGSGPVDRHAGPFHTVFLQHGLAVLAYDKRGYPADAAALDGWREPPLATLSADAAAALRFVAGTGGIDQDRIGLFATSQGGWTAPPAAVAVPETDFLIVRVGPAQPAFETRLHEVRQELRSEGLAGLELDAAIELRREIYRLAMAGAPLAATDALVAPYLGEPWYRTAFGDGPISGRWSAEWWNRAAAELAHTPVPALERFAGPVLWFLAEHDENVPLVATRAALERAFAASPGDDHEIVVIEDAPHSFLVRTPEGPRYADGFFDRMGEWLAERGLSDPGCWGPSPF